MNTLKLHLHNETSRLRAVIIGTATSNGEIPKLEEAYDPKSRKHIAAGTYPKNEDMILEMAHLAAVLVKHNVDVYQPVQIQNYNQIFTRDIGFVIGDTFVRSNILPDREQEIVAIKHVLDKVNNVIKPPEEVHIEGGDVMLCNDYILVGTYRGDDYPDYITARTNTAAISWLQEKFPNKKVKSFNLRKNNLDPYENALHLDCCFQPVGADKCIIHKNGFLEEEEYQWLLDLYGKDNCFEISKEEMYNMTSNIFSIGPDVVISERGFTRLNAWLRSHNITVEEIPYAQIAKQEGLLRCSTLPLIRD